MSPCEVYTGLSTQAAMFPEMANEGLLRQAARNLPTRPDQGNNISIDVTFVSIRLTADDTEIGPWC